MLIEISIKYFGSLYFRASIVFFYLRISNKECEISNDHISQVYTAIYECVIC